MCQLDITYLKYWSLGHWRPFRLGIVNSKKFCLIKCFSADFTPKATDQPSIFSLASIRTGSGLKVKGSEINLNKSCSNQTCEFVTETFKIGITNSKGFFDLSNFYIIKFITDFEAALQLQIEAKQKMLGRSVAFDVKSVEKRSIRQNFF